jgi:hypothetical protein
VLFDQSYTLMVVFYFRPESTYEEFSPISSKVSFSLHFFSLCWSSTEQTKRP